jgi:DNA-binding CsgD family transcriptional regulator
MSSMLAMERVQSLRDDDPDAIRARVVETVREVTRSSAAAWFRFGMVEGRPLPTAWTVRGIDELFVARRLEEGLGWPHADPRVPDARWHGRFVSARSVLSREAGLHGSALHERCHRPLGVHDFLRMIVVHEGCFVGWIGALRVRGEPAFSTADARRIAPLAGAIAHALVEADALERASSVAGGCDLVLRADGAVEMASASAHPFLARRGTQSALRAWAHARASGGEAPEVVHGHLVRWARLRPRAADRAPSELRLLLRLDPVPPLRLHPSYVLSGTQREIGALAAAGATVDDIARMAGMAPATVRSHLRVAYDRLGVASRTELARALEGAPCPTPGCAC